jgi:hypothetical protein
LELGVAIRPGNNYLLGLDDIPNSERPGHVIPDYRHLTVHRYQSG